MAGGICTSECPEARTSTRGIREENFKSYIHKYPWPGGIYQTGTARAHKGPITYTCKPGLPVRNLIKARKLTISNFLQAGLQSPEEYIR